MKITEEKISLVGIALACIVYAGMFLFTSAGQTNSGGGNSTSPRSGANSTASVNTAAGPKYVFMFI